MPPPAYGGVERGAFELSKGLRERGHNAFLLASGDSQPDDIPLYPLAPVHFWSLDTPPEKRSVFMFRADSAALTQVGRLASTHDIEIVNVRFERARMVRLLGHVGLPIIATISTRPTPPVLETLSQPNVTFTAHTNAHKKSIEAAYGQPLPQLHVVHYGIDMRHIPTSNEPLCQSFEAPTLPLLQQLKASGQDYLLHLARIHEFKGQASSIAIARQAGLPLILAGKAGNEPGAAEYFRQKVLPHIDGKNVHYFGPANDSQKYELMRFATATLCCSGLENRAFAEPFGRTIAEGQAAGSPGIGYNYGAFPEITEQGVSGFTFSTIDEAIEQVTAARTIDRQKCAEWARRENSLPRFVKSFEGLCNKILARQ